MVPPNDDWNRFLNELRERLDVELVLRHWGIEIVREAGGLKWACCPLHEENTPSFKTGPDTKLWYCFGACGEGGDSIRLIQRRLGLSFPDAVRHAAEVVGLDVPEMTSGRGGRAEDDPRFKALAEAEDLYRKALLGQEGRQALAYLEERGFGRNVIESFGLGFAPSNSPLVRRFGSSANWREAAEASGLVRFHDRSGDWRDFFYGRLMIPIRDPRGRTIAFGGRLLPGQDGPKYINTPETALFHKGRVFYGYDRAEKFVREKRRMILVEGYTDVMALHSAGLGETVAVLGTATTPMHAGLVKRTGAKQVVLLFDGDEAGRKAACKALKGLLSLPTEFLVVRIPDGADPADIAQRDGAPGLEALIEAGSPWLSFVVEGIRPKSSWDRVKALEELYEMLEAMENDVLADDAVRQVAEALELDLVSLRDEFRKWRAQSIGSAPAAGSLRRESSRGPGSSTAESPSAAAAPTDPEERDWSMHFRRMSRRLKQAIADLLGAGMLSPDCFPAAEHGLKHFLPRGASPTFDAMCRIWHEEEEDPTADRVLMALGSHPAAAKVVSLVEAAGRATSLRDFMENALEVLQDERRKEALQHVLEQIRRVEQAQTIQSVDSKGGAVDLDGLIDELMRLMADLKAGRPIPDPLPEFDPESRGDRGNSGLESPPFPSHDAPLGEAPAEDPEEEPDLEALREVEWEDDLRLDEPRGPLPGVSSEQDDLRINEEDHGREAGPGSERQADPPEDDPADEAPPDTPPSALPSPPPSMRDPAPESSQSNPPTPESSPEDPPPNSG